MFDLFQSSTFRIVSKGPDALSAASDAGHLRGIKGS